MEPIEPREKYTAGSSAFSKRMQTFKRKTAKRLSFWKKEFRNNPLLALLKGLGQLLEDVVINIPVKIFWKISDYGSRTLPIVLSFIILNVFFTFVYVCVIPAITAVGGADPVLFLSTAHPILGFMQSVMIIFSITDMATWSLDFFPMLCVLVHVVLGYFILAALVTRFAVMFQTRSQ